VCPVVIEDNGDQEADENDDAEDSMNDPADSDIQDGNVEDSYREDDVENCDLE
jgi:hypothetical protein